MVRLNSSFSHLAFFRLFLPCLVLRFFTLLHSSARALRLDARGRLWSRLPFPRAPSPGVLQRAAVGAACGWFVVGRRVGVLGVQCRAAAVATRADPVRVGDGAEEIDARS